MDNSVSQIHSYSKVSANDITNDPTSTKSQDIEQSVALCYGENSIGDEIVLVDENEQEKTNPENKDGKDILTKQIIQVLSAENVENFFCIDDVKQEYTVTEINGTTFNIKPLTYQDINLMCAENSVIYVCDVCNKTFRKKSNLTRHYRSHTGDNPHQCDQCESRFPTLSRLKEHLHAHTGLRPYACNMCDKTFARVSNLTRHSRTHNSEKPFECNKCNSRFVELTRLKEHYLTHVGEKRFSCDVCGKRFLKKYNLKRHFRTHSGDRPHKCETCGKAFSKKSYLHLHSETHTHDLMKQNDLVVIDADSAIKDVALNCVVECTSDFQNDEQTLEAKVSECDQHLSTRQKRHSEKRNVLSCTECDATFLHASRLREHSVTHSKEKSYSCDVCERSFGRNSNLLRHLEIHTGEKRFSCEICKKRFRNNTRLKEHVFLHSGDRPQACDICNKEFRHKFALQRHLLTHSAEKPHKCEFCGKRFSRKNRLGVHLKKHHSDSKFPNRVEPRLMNIIQNLEARLSESVDVDTDQHVLRSSKRKKTAEQSEEMEELTVEITTSDSNVVFLHNLRSRSKSKLNTTNSLQRDKIPKSELSKKEKTLHKKKSSRLSETTKQKTRISKKISSETFKSKNKIDGSETAVCQSILPGQVIIDDLSVYQNQVIDNSLDTFVVVKSAS